MILGKLVRAKKFQDLIKKFLKIKCPIGDPQKKLTTFFKINKINLFVDQSYFPISKNFISKIKSRVFNLTWKGIRILYRDSFYHFNYLWKKNLT